MPTLFSTSTYTLVLENVAYAAITRNTSGQPISVVLHPTHLHAVTVGNHDAESAIALLDQAGFQGTENLLINPACLAAAYRDTAGSLRLHFTGAVKPVYAPPGALDFLTERAFPALETDEAERPEPKKRRARSKSTAGDAR